MGVVQWGLGSMGGLAAREWDSMGGGWDGAAYVSTIKLIRLFPSFCVARNLGSGSGVQCQ